MNRSILRVFPLEKTKLYRNNTKCPKAKSLEPKNWYPFTMESKNVSSAHLQNLLKIIIFIFPTQSNFILI